MKPTVIAMLLLGGLMPAQEPKGLVLKARIELPNVNGRIDHFSADLKGQRLFMAALGNHTVEVMDIQAQSVSTPYLTWPSHKASISIPPPIACSSPAPKMARPKSSMAARSSFWRQ